MANNQQQRPTEGLMRISELARAASVSKQTVEYYIMIGLLTPHRPPGRKGRYFDAGHVKRIQLIRQLNDSGYTLRAIRETYFKGK